MTTIHRFHSVGDWEALYIDGTVVKQNHIGRIDVLDYIEEGMEIEKAVSCRVNLPEERHSYPNRLKTIIESEEFDYDGRE